LIVPNLSISTIGYLIDIDLFIEFARLSNKEYEDVLNDLVMYARSGDVVIVTKLDRLGRSLSQVLSQVLSVLNQLTSKEVTLITLDGAVDTSIYILTIVSNTNNK